MEINELQNLVVDNIERILTDFGIEYEIEQNRIYFQCPLHDSDNDDSLSIILDGHSQRGVWRCWTNGCENEILNDTVNGESTQRPRGKGIFGLIRGLLSLKWQRHCEYKEAIKWASEYLSVSFSVQDNVIQKYSNDLRILTKQVDFPVGTVNREFVRKQLVIPAEFYLKKGFSLEILDRYDVGLCTNVTKPMYNRVVFPIYDENYKFLGCTGRSLEPQCELCKKYHPKYKQCPVTKYEKFLARKWLNSTTDFFGAYFYNYWLAKPFIQESNQVVLVEGQADILSLEQAGIRIGLGLFGDSLTQQQKLLLDKLGVLTIILATDSDEAGQKSRKTIRDSYSRYFNIIDVFTETKDVGDMSKEEVNKIFQPFLETL